MNMAFNLGINRLMKFEYVFSALEKNCQTAAEAIVGQFKKLIFSM